MGTKTVGKGWQLIMHFTSQTINFNLKLMTSKHKIKLTASYRILSTLCTCFIQLTSVNALFHSLSRYITLPLQSPGSKQITDIFQQNKCEWVDLRHGFKRSSLWFGPHQVRSKHNSQILWCHFIYSRMFQYLIKKKQVVLRLETKRLFLGVSLDELDDSLLQTVTIPFALLPLRHRPHSDINDKPQAVMLSCWNLDAS